VRIAAAMDGEMADSPFLFRGAIAARATREMGPEESDFLVFEPLGQKMTHRTIPTSGDPRPPPR